MGLPASVRVNALFPFPVMVTASAPATITKVNGIWAVGLSFNGLGQLAAGSDPTTKQVMVFDLITKTFLVTTVSALLTAYTTRIVTAAGNIAVAPSDRMILVNQVVSQAVQVILPASAARLGAPVTVKDFAGVARNFPLTFVANGGELIDGQPTQAINDNYEAMTLNPISTGGWWIG